MNREIARIAAQLTSIASMMEGAVSTKYIINGQPAACINPEWLLEAGGVLRQYADELLTLINDGDNS